MIDMRPEEGLHPEIALLLTMLREGTREWRSELSAVPREKVLWQPFPHGHSIGAVILHIADVEAYWVGEVAQGRPRSGDQKRELLSEETCQYSVRWPEPPDRPLSW